LIFLIHKILDSIKEIILCNKNNILFFLLTPEVLEQKYNKVD